jgi:AraC-like DNA-binding protein
MHSSLLASSTLVVWKAYETYGLDGRDLFERAGLDPEQLDDPNARYPYEAVRRLWELAIEGSGDPCFALAAARQWHPSNFHALGYAWLASPSLKEALQRLIRYFRVVSTDPEELALEEQPDAYRFVIDTDSAVYRSLDEEYDFFLAILLDACRLSLGGEFYPRRVQLQRPRPACVERYQAFFGAELEFDAPEYSLHFDKPALERLLPTGNAEVARANDQVIMAYLAQLQRDDLVMQVKVALIDRLPSGPVSKEQLSEALGVSVRTLQRKLADEGTSFKQLLDETRRDLAEGYIKNPQVSIGEITYLLGFSEVSNFSRAFKRWTGLAPAEFRRSCAG